MHFSQHRPSIVGVADRLAGLTDCLKALQFSPGALVLFDFGAFVSGWCCGCRSGFEQVGVGAQAIAAVTFTYEHTRRLEGCEPLGYGAPAEGAISSDFRLRPTHDSLAVGTIRNLNQDQLLRGGNEPIRLQDHNRVLHSHCALPSHWGGISVTLGHLEVQSARLKNPSSL